MQEIKKETTTQLMYKAFELMDKQNEITGLTFKQKQILNEACFKIYNKKHLLKMLVKSRIGRYW